jgi:Flp pilus assembly pilin Flp
MRRLGYGLWQDEAGLAAVEYALLLALVVLVSLTAFVTLGNRMGASVGTTASDLSHAPTT